MPLVLEEKIIEKCVGSTYFSRGRAYFNSGKVLGSSIDYEKQMISGSVMGRGGIYKTGIFLQNETIIRTACSCPMVSDCKHVAALYLEALEQYLLDREPGGISRSSGDPGIIAARAARATHLNSARAANRNSARWSKLLGGLIDTEKQPQEELQVVLSLHKESGRWNEETSYKLKVRPRCLNMKTQKANFSKISWRDYYGSDFLPLSKSHIAFFRQLHRAVDDYGGPEWKTISDHNANDLWALFKARKNYAVEVFGGSKGQFPVEICDRPLELTFSLEDVTDGLGFKGKMVLDGIEIPVSRCIFFGDPVIFAVVLKSEPLRDWNEETAFDLYPVKSIPKEIVELTGDDLIIPAEDLDRFQADFLSKLTRKYTVHNRSRRVTVPETVSPKFLIEVSSSMKNGICVNLAFLYADRKVGIHDKTTVLVKSGERQILRNLEEEELLMDKAFPILLDNEIWIGGSLERMVEDSAKMKNRDAAGFLNEVLPQFMDDPRFTVVLADNVPKFVLDETPPLIEFSVLENEEDPDWFNLNIGVSIQGERVHFQELFKALSAGEEFLFLEDGRYFPLKSPAFDKLRNLITEAKGLSDHRKDGIGINRFQAGLWEELVKLGVIGQQAEKWQKAMKGLLEVRNIPLAESSKKLKAELRPYQVEGFSWLKFLREHNLGGVLADDMGLGKTVQTIALMVAAREKAKPFLIAAPTSVVENWDLELQKFAPHLKVVVLRRGDRAHLYKKIPAADAVVISYSLICRDFEYLKNLAFDSLILDEAQFVKNHQSKAYGYIRKIKCGTRIALTGTPMENNLMELWSIFSIVTPGLLGSPQQFQENYRRAIEKHGDRDVLAKLRSRLRPFMMRRKKELVAKELPPKIEQTVFLEMDEKHRHLYDLHLQRERQRILGMLQEGGLKDHRFEILAALTKMRQLCLHPGLIDGKHGDLSTTKLEYLKEQVQTLLSENHRVLVFSQFTGFLAFVRKMFDREGIKYLYLDGSTKNRGELIKKFHEKDGPGVFLISLKAGGLGLNLTAADYCILLDPWWNPAVERQAVDRAHRIGQHKQVFVYKMIMKDSIEEKVLKLQKKKQQLFESMIDGGNKFGSMVTEKDIRAIFD